MYEWASRKDNNACRRALDVDRLFLEVVAITCVTCSIRSYVLEVVSVGQTVAFFLGNMTSCQCASVLDYGNLSAVPVQVFCVVSALEAWFLSSLSSLSHGRRRYLASATARLCCSFALIHSSVFLVCFDGLPLVEVVVVKVKKLTCGTSVCGRSILPLFMHQSCRTAEQSYLLLGSYKQFLVPGEYQL